MSLFTCEEIRKICGGVFSGKVNPATEVSAVSTDTRVHMNNALFIALTGERFDAHDYLSDALANGAALLCVQRNKSDKLPKDAPALLVDSPEKAYQTLAAWHRKRFPALRIAALTGSCGKTSTKEILRTIFTHVAGTDNVLATAGNTNNQIGVPQNLLRLTAHHHYAVIEMGTNHHGEIEPLARITQPQTALIVSIGNCHLEAFRNLDGVATEKSHIFLPDSVQTAIYPYECGGHDILVKTSEKCIRKLTFGESPEADLIVRYLGGNLNGSSFELTERATGKKIKVDWNLTGKHQALNAGAAAAAALSFDIPLETVGEAIHEVTLPGFRMRKTSHNGTLWINDAYNANPDSMCATLAWLSEFADPEHLLLVLGDMGELGEGSLKGHLRVLSFALENLPGARIVAIGRKMTAARDVLNLTVARNITVFPSAKEAVKGVRDMARSNDLVLLKGSRSTGLEIIEPETV